MLTGGIVPSATALPILAAWECLIGLGRDAEALTILEKSLELSPNQEKVRTLVASLKGKK